MVFYPTCQRAVFISKTCFLFIKTSSKNARITLWIILVQLWISGKVVFIKPIVVVLSSLLPLVVSRLWVIREQLCQPRA